MADYLKIQSPFQEIKVVSDPMHLGEHILYLDHMWQYNSTYEYRYHEVIASMPALACEQLERVLVCGGGDGLAVRELLRFKGIASIDLVEIDPEMIRLFSSDPMLIKQNQSSLLNPRVNIHIQDATQFIRSRKNEYDLVILDFPSPGARNLGKDYSGLYCLENLQGFMNCLRPWGVLSSQTSLPSDILAPFVRYLMAARFNVWNYDVYYEHRSHDNLSAASRIYLRSRREVPRELRFITQRHVDVGFGVATMATEEDLEYYRLFEHAESIEAEEYVLGR